MSKAKRLVKKVGRAAKKIVKSDVFKYAALAYGGYTAYGALAGAGAAGGGGLSWGSIASAGLKGLEGLQGYQEAKAAARQLRAAGREQEAIDLENRLRLQEETAESARRTRKQQEITEGRTRANIAASGFGGGSSLDRYMTSMQAQHESDIEWMLQSGASQVQIMERESAARAAATRAQAKGLKRGRWSSLVKAGSSIAVTGTQQKWWS